MSVGPLDAVGADDRSSRSRRDPAVTGSTFGSSIAGYHGLERRIRLQQIA